MCQWQQACSSLKAWEWEYDKQDFSGWHLEVAAVNVHSSALPPEAVTSVEAIPEESH